MNFEFKTYENKLRRWAKNKNLILQKARITNKNDKEYMTYRLCDINTGEIKYGNKGGYGLSVDDIEKIINNL